MLASGENSPEWLKSPDANSQAYQRMNKRMEQGYLEREEYDAWVKEAAEKRDRCVAGELPYKEFADWIDGTSRQR